MDVEGGLIASVVLNGDLNKALERRVTAEFFSDPQHQRVWEYVVHHYTTYGTQPDADVVLQAYPSYEILPPMQTTEYFIEQLAKRRRKVILLNGIHDAVAASQAPDSPDDDIEMQALLREAMLQVDVETSAAVTHNYVQTLMRRIVEWRESPPDPGISFGFPTLDRLTGGIRPQQFVIFTGLPKTKKSWTLLYAASTAHAYDYPVGFITFEMSSDEQLERLTTLWAKVPFRRRARQGAAH